MNKSIRTRLLASIVLLVMSVGQSIYAHDANTFPGDIWAARFVQTFSNPFLDNFMIWTSKLFTGWPAVGLVAIALLVVWWRLGRLDALTLLTAALLSGVADIVKFLVNRPRPPSALVRILTPVFGLSFPSGHTFFAAMLLGTLAYFVLRHNPNSLWRALLAGFLIALIVIVGISRVYLGDHWGSDVVASFFFSAAFLLALSVFHDLLKPHFLARRGE